MSLMSTIARKTTTHKRDDTFSRLVTVTFDGAPFDLSSASVTSQVRSLRGDLIDTLTVSIDDAVDGKIEILSTDTSAWPLSDQTNPLLCDVKIVDGDTNRTETFQIHVVPQVTE